MNRRTTGAISVIVVLFGCMGYADIAVPFAPPVVLPMNGFGGDVTVADIDADGDIDIIATTRSPYFFWLSINDGSGVFAPAVQHAAGIVPRAIVAADFDNDGILDIATADQDGGSASVMVGDGAGGFAPPRTFATAPAATDLSCEDFNGDGLLDLVVAHRLFIDEVLMVLLNLGGTGAQWLGFQTAAPYSIGTGSRSVHAVDLDNDGKIDLIVTNREDLTISVLLGNGDGTFNPQIIFPSGNPRDAITGDFNGNGLLDVAVANFEDGMVLIYFNLGSDINGWLGLKAYIAYNTSGVGSHGITAGDIDLDGDLDLLVANSIAPAGVAIMLNNGKGVFTSMPNIPVGSFSTAAVAVGDFDADGDLDFATSSTAVSGSISYLINLLPAASPDINGDCVVDTADLGILIGLFGTNDPAADLNGDGVVDTADLGLLLAGFITNRVLE